MLAHTIFAHRHNLSDATTLLAVCSRVFAYNHINWIMRILFIHYVLERCACIEFRTTTKCIKLIVTTTIFICCMLKLKHNATGFCVFLKRLREIINTHTNIKEYCTRSRIYIPFSAPFHHAIAMPCHFACAAFVPIPCDSRKSLCAWTCGKAPL